MQTMSLSPFEGARTETRKLLVPLTRFDAKMRAFQHERCEETTVDFDTGCKTLLRWSAVQI